MRTIILLICNGLLFTSCITSKTIHKAKGDRRNEQVDRLLTSYKDTSGNLVIVYTKKHDRSFYRSVVPIDSIIHVYLNAKSLSYVNKDTTINNYKGVLFASIINNEPGFQRIVLFNTETPLKDTSGLYHEFKKNEQVVNIYTGKMSIPVVKNDSVYFESLQAKPVSFMYKTYRKDDVVKEQLYLITYEPHKRKYIRYGLVPFTASLDGVTAPFQLIGVGFMALLAAAMKF